MHKSRRTMDHAVRFAFCSHVLVTLNFGFAAVLTLLWLHYSWNLRLISSYVWWTHLAAKVSFLMPIVLLFAVICLPLSFSVRKRVGTVLASVSLCCFDVFVVILLMATPPLW